MVESLIAPSTRVETVRGGQSMIRVKTMKALTSGLSRVGAFGLPQTMFADSR